jgi:RNA methyltransferase, TrmH family
MTESVISSPHNSRITAARALLTRNGRSKASAFLAEGPHAVAEAVASSRHQVRELFVATDAESRHGSLIASAREGGAAVHVVSDRVLRLLRDTVTPQGVVAVITVRPEAGEALAAARLAVLLDRVADPGNVGTVVRTADAAGADLVGLTPGSADVYSGKCVRASAGSLFHLPVVTDLTVDHAAVAAGAAGCRVLATAADGESSLDDLIADDLLAAPTLWVFGSEAHGVSDTARAASDLVVRVPIYGSAESLNLAAAAAVCLYASARAQRR